MVTVIIFTIERALQPQGLLHSRGMAASEFPPLCNIPYCCLPQESGPCLSSSVADHPLKPAIDRRLGRPLPHQLSNLTRAHLTVINLSPEGRMRYQPSFPMVVPRCQVGSHALLTRPPLPTSRRMLLARLACIKPAASVRSEPGSNSHVNLPKYGT